MLAKIRRIYWYSELISKLGLCDILFVGYYRIILKLGLLKKKFPVVIPNASEPVFLQCPTVDDFPQEWKQDIIAQADKIIKGILPYYSHHWIRQSVPPNWFLNPFNGKECKNNDVHWTRISDFKEVFGDIKNIWEASRFAWTGILARAYAVSGKNIYLETLNSWISDWVRRNQINLGPNWKCGQEASVRMLNLLNAAVILKQYDKPTELLKELISLHVGRISSNIRYAFAQRNNHATSEAAALFIGGNWLARIDPHNSENYLAYAREGRSSLETLIRKLVYEDGSFAQHSMNYHRLFIDTLSIVTFWTRKLNLKEFTAEFNEIAQKSVDWILSVTDESGKCPNLGSNDGTMLMANHSCDYLDYRPSLQLASVLIKGQLTFENGKWDESLFWFGVRRYDYELLPLNKCSILHKSGYVIMKGENSWALLRYPFYKFRPSHNDVFHFDLWAKGKNILFDSGSFSYNPDKDCEVPDLKSVHSHNTLSFDYNEQMPRLGRFLLGKWIKPLAIGDIEIHGDNKGTWMGSYRDSLGNLHTRSVRWNNNTWQIHDSFGGKAKYVEIGYNFNDSQYEFENDNNTLLLSWGKIDISNIAENYVRRQIISNYYMQSSVVYRLIISIENNSEIITLINIY